MELKVLNPCQELLHPQLELRTRPDLMTTRGENEVFTHQAVNGVWVPMLPDLVPEVLDDRYAVTLCHGRDPQFGQTDPRMMLQKFCRL